MDRTVLFQGYHGQFWASIKQLGLDILEKSIKQPVLSIFQMLEAYNDQVL